MTLEGDANDYVEKDSRREYHRVPAEALPFPPEENILVGNVVLYGATSGEVFFNGVAGERFAVRNSGATAVVEGVGDHGCEYMTNGLVLVLGKTGKNFAAGMSGGVAYVLDESGEFAPTWCNRTGVDLDELDTKDMEAIRNLVERHVDYTESPRGKWILENWAEMLPKFVKVFPHEFKRVMGVPRTQQAVKTMAVKGSETTQEVRA